MADCAKTSLNTATVKVQWQLREAIEGCARHEIAGISPWRDQLHDMGVKQAARHIRDARLRVTGLCRGGMFTASEAGERSRMLDDNRRAVDEAAELDAACLVLVVGGLPPEQRDLQGAHRQVEDSLAELLPYARNAGVALAIEPLHPMYAADRACVNTMAHANDLCDRLGPGLGIAVDVYHVWWDRELRNQIGRAGKERLMAFHICDWLRETSDLLLDRGMMGDGVIDIPRIRSWVEEQGYAGLYEVEIFSRKNWWKRDPDDVLRIMKERIGSHV